MSAQVSQESCPLSTTLRALLDRAAGEGLAQNIDRFLQFLGHQEGDVIELQALGVPGRYQPSNCFTHTATVALAVAALDHMEESRAVGSYLLFNAVNPAVAARATAGSWHVAQKGQCTTDRDVVARRTVYIDIDAERPSGISATDQELECALRCAAQVLTWLKTRVPTATLGIGHSGNGVSLFIALERAAESPELSARIKALLAGLDLRFSGSGAKVDRSVCDAKRLCPAFGTTKRKGAADFSERPHRTTGFWCAPSPQRLPPEALGALVEALRSELDDAGKATVDRELGLRTAPANQPAPWPAAGAPDPSSPFTRANATPIADVIAWLELEQANGRVRCPGCGESDQGVAIVGNGLKCHHERCSKKGRKNGFRTVVDLVMEVREVNNKEAVNLLAERFGFEGMRPRKAKRAAARAAKPAEQAQTQAQVVTSQALVVATPEGIDAVKEIRPGADEIPVDCEALGNRRITVDLTDLEEYEVNDQVALALGNLDNLYQRLGHLVEVAEVPKFSPGKRTKPTMSQEIRQVKEAVVRDLMTRVCDFQSHYEKENGDIVIRKEHPPTWCVQAVAQRGQWKAIRPLNLVTDAPLILCDGTLISEPGYHAETGSLYLPKFELPPVAEHPSQEDVRLAAGELLEIVCDFPFKDPAHRAAWFGALLTPIARWAFEGQSPLFFADANNRGTGKGLLLKSIGLIVLGREMDFVVHTLSEEEERKRITSKVHSGAKAVSIDNVVKPFGSPVLDALITSGCWGERLLGTNDAPCVETFICWYASGNNVQFVRDDTRRRTCRIRLVAKQERPEERTGFRIPRLERFITQHRGRLFAAALTVLRGWIRSGQSVENLPGWGGPWGSFDGWDEVVRGAVLYAGLVDPIGAKATTDEGEAIGDGLAAMVAGLEEALAELGLKEATAAQLCTLLSSVDSWGKTLLSSAPRHAKLREGIVALSPHLRDRAPTSLQLGRMLGRLKERPLRVAEVLKQVNARILQGECLWRVDLVEAPQPSVARSFKDLDIDESESSAVYPPVDD